jgi:aspartate racemase
MTDNHSTPSLVGVLGGLGPASSVYFYNLLTSRTKAERDQDHIDMIISSRATTPDRTGFILGKISENPLNVMIEESNKMISYGADLIVIPCNTAHYFYDKLSESVAVPIMNIIRETVAHLAAIRSKKVGILATEGTVSTHTYQLMCDSFGLDWVTPDEKHQRYITDIIYGDIKSGGVPDMEKFTEAADSLFASGCDHVILGCTELSLLKEFIPAEMKNRFVDSLEILAFRTICRCKKTAIGFPDDFYLSAK